MYFLRHLRRAKVSLADMLQFYCTCIRSAVEHALPVFHYALPKLLSDDLERIEREALRTIPDHDLSYSDALHGCIRTDYLVR